MKQEKQDPQVVGGRPTALWMLVAAVGFLGGWVVHDELTSTAAATTTGVAAPAAQRTPADVTAATQAHAGDAAAPIVIVVAPPTAGAPTAVVTSAALPVALGSPPDQAPGSPPGAARPGSARATGVPVPARATSSDAPAPRPVTAPTTTTTWNVVLASDGSVVLMGPNGRLLANTGHASAGATVALDADESLIETGDWGPAALPGPGRTPPVTTTGTTTRPATVASAGSPATAAGLVPGLAGDFEDHSVHVVGQGQIVTNDDSNAFLDRDGQINSNTGDTDSSAINALDVTDSRIVSGSSAGVPDEPGEDETGDDESPDAAGGAAEDAAAPPAGAAPTPPPATGTPVPAPDDEDGDGVEVQDISVHATGTRNAVTQDDSSLVMGGTGHVNAQAGDSDTAGIVAMGVHGGNLESGCAGTQCAGTAGTP